MLCHLRSKIPEITPFLLDVLKHVRDIGDQFDGPVADGQSAKAVRPMNRGGPMSASP